MRGITASPICARALFLVADFDRHNSARMAAGQTELFGVAVNQAYKVAVITNT